MRIRPNEKSRLLGSRIELECAKKSLANFLDEDIRKSVINRLANPQNFQTLNTDRLYSDLLSSMPMCFNLFGTLQADLELATRAINKWWPWVPGRVCTIHFEWSPGRRISGKYLENRTAFDVAFEIKLSGGGRGILGIETKYHEHCKRESSPSTKRIDRYKFVSERSAVFTEGAIDSIISTDLQQVWLDHLLALSMLQETSNKWKWAAFVLVHPAKNPSFAHAAERYKKMLIKPDSFHVKTIEELLNENSLPESISSAFSERYLW